jgi:phosphate starvation-inducible PhoH-like protein
MLIAKRILSTKFTTKYELTNSKQIKLQNIIQNDNNKIIVVTGVAGTGKTMIACNEAIKMFKENKINKIVITRPTIPVDGEDLGFLPGTLQNKIYPYLIPVYDYFLDHYTQDQLLNLINSKKIEVCPLAYMRGRTFKNTIILADEMQNTTPNQMKMILTRLGINSKIIITGDLEQSDILKYNGLQNLLELMDQKYPEYYKMIENNIAKIELDESCIQRSEIIKTIINLYK